MSRPFQKVATFDSQASEHILRSRCLERHESMRSQFQSSASITWHVSFLHFDCDKLGTICSPNSSYPVLSAHFFLFFMSWNTNIPPSSKVQPGNHHWRRSGAKFQRILAEHKVLPQHFHAPPARRSLFQITKMAKNYHRQLENNVPLEDWQFSRSKLLVGRMGIHFPPSLPSMAFASRPKLSLRVSILDSITWRGIQNNMRKQWIILPNKRMEKIKKRGSSYRKFSPKWRGFANFEAIQNICIFRARWRNKKVQLAGAWKSTANPVCAGERGGQFRP